MLIPNHQDSNYAIDILKKNPEIFRLLIRSEYLAAKEYGKLLLLTSKSLTKACFVREEVYDWLCRSRWGDNARKMIDEMGISPCNCFNLLQKQKSRRPNVPYLELRPLQYAPEDYRLVITVFDDHGYPRVSKFLQGQDIPSFFEVGSLVLNGLHDLAMQVSNSDYYDNCSRNPFQKWKTTVHAFRIPDQKSLCLYHSDKNSVLKGLRLSFSTNDGPLQMNDGYGLQLLECRDTISVDCRHYEGIVFDFNMEMSIHSIPNENGEDTRENSKQADFFFFNSLRLDAYVMDDHGDVSTIKFPRKLGKVLEFAHILESLYGWQN
jgi:hypothetical protein